jgi:hypothetical protein
LADIAELGIRIVDKDVVRATKSLNELDASAKKVNASASQISSQSEARHKKRIAELEREWQANKKLKDEQRAAMLQAASVANAAKANAAAQAAQAAAMLKTEQAAKRVRESVTSMAASMLGAAPGVTQFTSVLGTMAFGSVMMVAVLAGMAALAKAWDLITEKSRTAKKAQEEAIERLRQLAAQQRQGALGSTPEDIQKALARSAEIQRQLATRGTIDRFGEERGGLSASRRAQLQKELADLKTLTQAGYVAIQAVTDDAEREREDKARQASANRLAEEKAALDALHLMRVAQFDREIATRAAHMQKIQNLTTSGALGGGARRASGIEGALNPAPTGEGAIRGGFNAEAGLVQVKSAMDALKQYAGVARDVFRDLKRIYSDGSAGMGALQGAISGFSMSGGNPIATAVGALAGLAAGILGAGKAAREAAKELQKAKFAFDVSLEGIRALVDGPDSLAALNFAFLEVTEQFNKLREQIKATFKGDEAIARLDELGALEKRRVEQLRAEYDALKKVNEENSRRATYDKALADMDKGIARDTRIIEQELARQLAVLDVQENLLRSQLDTAQESLRLQEQEVEQTRRVLESLASFAAGLKLGPQSVLSPVEKLEEARRQYNSTLSSAYAGNKDAALALPDAARSLLDASREVNASGMLYVKDFQRVQATIAGVTDQFGSQLTVESMMLKQLEIQTATLQAQLDAINAARAQAKADADRQVASLSNLRGWLENANAGPLANPPRFGTPHVPPIDDAPSGGGGRVWGGPTPIGTSEAAVAVLQEGFTQVVGILNTQNEAIAENTRQIRKINPLLV